MKKLISVILVLCMAVLVIPFSAAAETLTEQQQYIKDMGYASKDSGWKAIGSADDFAKIGVDTAYPLDGKYYVTADISANNQLITEEAFSGVIDGCGYTVTFPETEFVVTEAKGFIANKFSGTLKNIKLDNLGISGQREKGMNIAPISNEIPSDANVLIENVTVTGNFDFTTNQAVNSSFFFGKTNKCNVTMVNCKANGTITTASSDETKVHLGGVVGQISGATNLTVVNFDSTGVYFVNNGGTTVFNEGAVVGGSGQTGAKLNFINCKAPAGKALISDNAKSGTITVFDKSNLSMVEGASIRYTAGSTGMRFATKVDSAALDALVTAMGAANVKMGTVITPTAYATGAGALTMEKLDAYKETKGFTNPAYLNVEFDPDTNTYYEQDTTTKTFSGAVANILSDNYELSYSAVGYIAVKVNNEWVYIYADYNADNARTVKTVAQSALDKDDYAGDDVKKQILLSFGATESAT